MRVSALEKAGDSRLEDGDVGDVDAGGPALVASCPVVGAMKRNAGV